MDKNQVEGVAGQGKRVMALLRNLGTKVHLTVNKVQM